MIDYLKNVLPRLQSKSKNLDHMEVFLEKPWLMIQDGVDDVLEYEFFRDQRLLVSKGGEITWGRWELTPSSQRLILEYADKKLLLKHAFIDDAIMIVKLSGSVEPSIVFINQSKIPDRNYKAYLDRVVSSLKSIESPHQRPQQSLHIQSNSSAQIQPNIAKNQVEGVDYILMIIAFVIAVSIIIILV